MRILAFPTSFTAALIWSSSIMAACDQDDLIGKYQAYTPDAGTGYSTSCMAKIGSEGKLEAGTPCRYVFPDGSIDKDTITGGKLNVASSCKVTGTVKVGGDKLEVKHGWLSRDLQTLMLITNDGVATSVVTAVRR